MRISRRSLLRGAGASLALPWLEAMASGKTAAAPVRMAVLYMPNGVNVNKWTPEGEGRDFRFSPTLEPLEPFKNQTLVLSNMWNAAANTGDGHYVKESSILTCTTISKTLGVDINMHGVSMDQVAASRAGKRTPIASLELGIEPESTGVDTNVGYTRVYGAHIAWSTPTTPLAREINPRAVWERLFRAGQPGGEREKSDALLLDKVLGEAKRLRAELGKADQKRIDEYLEVVRGLEERLAKKTGPGQSEWTPRAQVTGEAPADPSGNRAVHVRLMMDMIAL